MKILYFMISALITTSSFAGESIFLCKSKDKKIQMEIVSLENASKTLSLKLNMPGKLEMTGEAGLIHRFGIYEGALTEMGDPLEFVLIYLEKSTLKASFSVLLKLEDGEEVSDYLLSCQQGS